MSSFHVFATTAQPTSNLVWAQKLWSIRVCTCIQVCVCICIDQELAFVFLLGDINMISVFPALSGPASLGIFQSHIPIASWYPCLVSSKTGAAPPYPLWTSKASDQSYLFCGLGNSWTTTNCSVRLLFKSCVSNTSRLLWLWIARSSWSQFLVGTKRSFRVHCSFCSKFLPLDYINASKEIKERKK